VFIVACIVSFVLRLEWGIAISQLPIYVYELGGSPIEVGLVFTVFAGIMIFTQPLWGYFSDYLGRRKPFIVLGMMGLSPIFLLMSTQTQVIPLILLRGSTALFVGAMVPATWALVSNLTSYKTLGKRMGFLTSAEMAGFGIGPVLGGLIADFFGFNTLWIFVSLLCLAGGLIFLIFGSDPPVLNRDLQKPVFSRGSLKKETLRKLLILFIVFPLSLMGIALLGPNRNVYLVRDIGMSRTMVGSLDLIGTFFSTLLQPLAGSFSDKYGRKPLMTLSAISLIAGLLTLYLARDFLQTIPSIILMTNYNSFQMAASAYVSDSTKPEERGGSLGFLNAVASVSRSLGAILGGLIIVATSIRAVILLSIIFPAVSIAIIIFALKEPKKG